MRSFRNLPIRRKLLILTSVTSIGALLIAGAALTVVESRLARQRLIADTLTIADVIGFNITSALVFSDREAATETLSALRNHKSIIAAAIYDVHGKLFASHFNISGNPKFPEDLSQIDSLPVVGLRQQHPVTLEGRTIGTVILDSDLTQLHSTLRAFILLLLAVGAIGVLTTMIASSSLQRMVSTPILSLAHTAREITDQKDYGIRAVRSSSDEVGQLIDAFNEMLQQIQNREDRLQRAHDELEHRVEERTIDLAASNRELESFSYSVSHDLRAPLRVIDGFTQALEEELNEKLDDRGKHLIARLRTASLRMSDIVEGLLVLARVTKNDMHRGSVDLTTLAKSVNAELSRANADREVTVSIASNLHATGDVRLLGNVLENLLGNAWKFTHRTPNARIEFGCDERGTETVFYVRDNGAGFDMNAAETRLFKTFQRMHTFEEFPGTGIGLATVARVISRHGGRVWADSAPGKGTTIYFTLAAAAEHTLAS